MPIINKKRTLAVPLCVVPCSDPVSGINRNLNRWTYMQQQEHVKVRNHLQKAFTLADQTEQLNALGPNRKKAHKKTYSKLLAKFPKSNVPPVYPAPRPDKAQRCFNSPLEVDDLYPAMACHLHNVMEADSMLNKIYNITYYNNCKPEDTLNRPPEYYLNPLMLAELLDILRRGGQLTPEQWEYLKNFLKAAALLGPLELLNLLKMLQAAGLLSPQILLMLRKLLKEISSSLNTSQMHMLLAVLFDIAKMDFPPKRKAPRSAYRRFNYVEGQPNHHLNSATDSKRYGQHNQWHLQFDHQSHDQFDHQSHHQFGNQSQHQLDHQSQHQFDHQLPYQLHNQSPYQFYKHANNRWDNQAYNEFNEQYKRDRNIGVNFAEPSDMDSNQENIRYSRELDEIYIKYYKPWDADLHTEAAQALVRRSTIWRMSRLNLADFQYNRGLEKYLMEGRNSDAQTADSPTISESQEHIRFKVKRQKPKKTFDPALRRASLSLPANVVNSRR